MDLKKSFIHRNYRKAHAVSQITVGDDIAVPETKPRVAQILQKQGDLVIQEVHMEKGRIHLKGVLQLKILYTVRDGVMPVDSLEPELPFDETLYVEGASQGDNLKIDWDMEELLVSVIHSGKIGVRSVLTLYADVSGAEAVEVTEGVEEHPDVFIRTCPYEFSEPVLDRKDTFRVRDEVTLPANKPNIQKLLWKSMQVRGLDLRILEGQVGVKGEMLLFVLYESDGEDNVQWLEQSIPFHGTLDASGITPEMYGWMQPAPAHQEIEVKPDYDGEMRTLQAELLLDIQMRIYEEKSVRLLCDAYSTDKELILRSAPVESEKLLSCNRSKTRILERVGIEEGSPAILQLLGHQADLRRQSYEITAEGILVQGEMEVQIIYIAADDQMPFGVVTAKLPYRQEIQLPGLREDDQMKISETIEQISVGMPDGTQVEIKGTIQTNVCVMRKEEMENIAEITAQELDAEQVKKLPGMVIHCVQPQETLWDIAKKNRSTQESIRKQNDMSGEEVVPGQKLILLKQVAEKLQ